MSDIASRLIGRKFDQICFVVPDIEAAIETWKKTNGVQVWNIAYDLAKEQTQKEYRGEPGDFQFSCAYGFAGDTLIELARHDGGRSLYQDWIDTRGYGPHHIGFRQHDAEEYALAERHYRDQGLEKAMAGFFEGPFGNCRWSYWDTRELIGFYTELYYVDGDLNERMAALRRGENVSITS